MDHFLDKFGPGSDSPPESTKEEKKQHFLDKFSPDSEEKPPVPLSKLASAAIGAGQGATLGFGDELAAAAKALYSAPIEAGKKIGASGDLSLGNIGSTIGNELKDQYINTRDSLRNLDKQAQENPISYGAGELAGGLALPLGAVGKGYKAIKNLPLLARLAEGGLGSRIAGKGLQIAGNAALGGASGAAIGGIAAAGKSEATSPEELASDIGEGAEQGGEVGGLLPIGTGIGGAVAGYAGNKLADSVKGIHSLKLLTQPFIKGLQGVNLGIKPQEEATEGFAKSVGTGLTDLKKDLSDQYDKFINEAEQNGTTVDLGNIAKKIVSDAGNLMHTASPEEQSDIAKVIAQVKKYVPVPDGVPDESTAGLITNPSTSIAPRTAKELETSLGEIAQNRGAFPRNADKQISDALAEQVPGIAETNTDYKNMSNALDALGVKKIYQQQFGDDTALPSTQFSKLLGLIQNQGAEGTKVGQVTRDKLNNAVNALKQVQPDLADKLENALPEVSENYNLAKQLNKPSLTYGHGILPGIFGNLIKAGGTLGNFAGRALNENGEALTNFGQKAALTRIADQVHPKDLSKAIYNLPNSDLHTVASDLNNDPNLAGQGQALQTALDNNNEISKNAVLFNLLQTKEGRQALKSYAK